MKYQSIALKLLEENENTPLEYFASALINSVQISFVKYKTVKSQKHAEHVLELFLLPNIFQRSKFLTNVSLRGTYIMQIFALP